MEVKGEIFPPQAHAEFNFETQFKADVRYTLFVETKQRTVSTNSEQEIRTAPMTATLQ